MARPRQLVSPPTFADRNFGLLSAVEPRYDVADDHWRNGVRWQDLCGDGSATYDTCQDESESTPADKVGNVDVTTWGANPFTVFAEIDCPPVGYSQEELRARATDALTRVEAFQVEQAFWTGSVSNDADIVYPHLAANSTVTEGSVLPLTTLQTAASAVSGSVVLDVVEALGRLESAWQRCSAANGQGVVHVPTILGPALFSQHLVKADGAILRTQTGNRVALGAGYPGTSPAGLELANISWMYMTGPVVAYRSREFTFRFPEMFDRDDNTLKAIVERTYVLAYSGCCVPAVPVSVGGDVTGQPLSAF